MTSSLNYSLFMGIDSIKKDMKAFALDQNGKNEVDEAGFAIIDFMD